MVSRCIKFPELRPFVINRFPGINCRFIALKARNVALKDRTKFGLKFVRDFSAKTDVSPFRAAVPFRDLQTNYDPDSGLQVQNTGSAGRVPGF